MKPRTFLYFITQACLVILKWASPSLIVLSIASPCQSKGISLIRDLEIELFVHQLTAPLLMAAGLNSETVKIHIVNDRELNAFVSAGRNIFLNTGLLLEVESENEISGVIAHEVGHIAAGHLPRTHQALRNSTTTNIVSMALGAAAAISGQGQAAGAIIAGGQQLGLRSFLRYSRAQEAAADQAALSILKKSNQSVQGLFQFLTRIGEQETLKGSRQDKYLRSHPLTRDRLFLLQNQISQSHDTEVFKNPTSKETLLRVQAKIRGFLDPPNLTLRRYPESDQTIAARYARAAAYHKLALSKKALEHVKSLLLIEPQNPFFHELLGQILFESGQAADAIAPYSEAVTIKPESALLKIGLARSQIATDDRALFPEAIRHLRDSIRLNKEIAIAWQQLAIALGRQGAIAESSLASAEYNLLIGRPRDAARFAARAEGALPEDSPGHLRALDLLKAVGKSIPE